MDCWSVELAVESDESLWRGCNGARGVGGLAQRGQRQDREGILRWEARKGDTEEPNHAPGSVTKCGEVLAVEEIDQVYLQLGAD